MPEKQPVNSLNCLFTDDDRTGENIILLYVVCFCTFSIGYEGAPINYTSQFLILV
jgi:hypothetical protein